MKKTYGTGSFQGITTPEVMYAMVYKSCGSFLENSYTKEGFFDVLDSFIEQDLTDKDAQACFLFVRRRLRKLSFDQITYECQKIPEILAKVNDKAYSAMADFDIDRMLRELD